MDDVRQTTQIRAHQVNGEVRFLATGNEGFQPFVKVTGLERQPGQQSGSIGAGFHRRPFAFHIEREFAQQSDLRGEIIFFRCHLRQIEARENGDEMFGIR